MKRIKTDRVGDELRRKVVAQARNCVGHLRHWRVVGNALRLNTWQSPIDDQPPWKRLKNAVYRLERHEHPRALPPPRKKKGKATR